MTQDAPLESYDTRRVNVLKSQVIQLERQVMAQENGMRLREGVLHDLSEYLKAVLDAMKGVLQDPETKLPAQSQSAFKSLKSSITHIQSYISQHASKMDRVHSFDAMEDDDENSRGGRLVLFLNEFLKMPSNGDSKDIARLQGKKLGRKKANHSIDNDEVMDNDDNETSNEQRRDSPITASLLDICSGKTDHLNLRHISRLEGALVALQKDLKSLSIQLGFLTPVNERKDLSALLETLQTRVSFCCNALLSLSVLVPAAPLPELESLLPRPGLPTIPTAKDILAQFPKLSELQRQRIEPLLSNLCKGIEMYKRLSDSENSVLQSELDKRQHLVTGDSKSSQQLLEKLNTQRRDVRALCEEIVVPELKSVLEGIEGLRVEFTRENLVKFLGNTEETVKDMVRVVEEEVCK